MKKNLWTASSVCFFIVFILISFNCTKNEADKEMSDEDMVAKGKYLVTIGGCTDCHSPKVMTQMGPMPDTTRLFSGHPGNEKLPPVDTNSAWMHTNSGLTAWIGPWGMSFTANLTPDGATGLGNWTEEIFIKALRTGKHMGYGRNILPPMPWFNYAEATDDDLKAIFAYLKSLPPIKNKVPDPIPPDSVAVAKL